MLPLTFANPADYDLIREDDLISLSAKEIAPGKQVKAIITHSDNTTNEILLNHTFNEQQILWFKSGSALNIISKQK
jgi:aconitate hydratase